MSNQITVKYEIERSSEREGKLHEDVRFWLETVVNGKTHMSRGTVVSVVKDTLVEVRQQCRGIVAFAQAGIEGMDAKSANSALAGLVEQAMTVNEQIDDAITEISDLDDTFDAFFSATCETCGKPIVLDVMHMERGRCTCQRERKPDAEFAEQQAKLDRWFAREDDHS